ncbi:MAG TPA: HAMP domain-containing sensor histidine kinase [Thermoclostridium sp.]|nr:HAMP domain-containing sensor histidine kinase [Thermoclostridium sp.]
MVIKEKVELNAFCSQCSLVNNGCNMEDCKLIGSPDSKNEVEEQSDWIYALSHELRTPLNVILSTIQVSKLNTSGKYSKVKIRYLDIMKQNCLRLLKMVNNILEINRLDSGFYSVDLKNDDIVGVIKDITFSITDYAKTKNVKLSFDSNKLEHVASIDNFQIERIMLNLLSNAIKFTPSGGEIKVNINIQNTEILISVTDTGPGIPTEYQNTIFGKCNQTDGKSLVEKKGSGMGLYIVKRLLDNMNGEIYAFNNKEKGTTVIFSIPNQRLPEAMKEPLTKEYKKCREEYLEIEFSDIYNH